MERCGAVIRRYEYRAGLWEFKCDAVQYSTVLKLASLVKTHTAPAPHHCHPYLDLLSVKISSYISIRKSEVTNWPIFYSIMLLINVLLQWFYFQTFICIYFLSSNNICGVVWHL